ncbi:methyltransferase domain-containing protein [Methanobacterium spitsbergense]|uniref:Class I SAM-dependent methyltransferase n=1 Tax=Methanobacterium spitsbergense TaxID=2874285 RepID=A0A8T5UYR1_9EURY|nr:class I SAM-dependent methyltransferase [Methanobacterium spitsbergense]
MAFDVDKSDVVYLSNLIKKNKIKNICLSEENGYSFSSDIVIASEVFEHVLDPLNLVLNIKKVMCKNSQFFVTTPNGFGPGEIRNRLFFYLFKHNNFIRKLLNKPKYVIGNGSSHCQFFTETRITNLFSKLNFKKISVKNSSIYLSLYHLTENEKNRH